MKILFAATHTDAWGYIPEMIDAFREGGCEVDLFDDYLSPPKTLFERAMLRLGYSLENVQVRSLRKQIKQLPNKYDVVNIQYIAPIYKHLIEDLRPKGKRLIASIWGSDFLRANETDLNELQRILSFATTVTTNNPEIRGKLLSTFPDLNERVEIVPFGLKSVDTLREIQATESQSETRTRLGIPTDLLTLACGYNNLVQQQHHLMCKGISMLPKEVKNEIFVLLPMTYPVNPNYASSIASQFEAAEVRYKVFDRRLSLEDICRLRIVTDCAVNVQTTDSLSASIQEHLLARSALIVGKWLPYEIFANMGAKCSYVQSSEDICEAILKFVADPAAHKQHADCAQKIYDFSCWRNCGERWLRVFEGLPAGIGSFENVR